MRHLYAWTWALALPVLKSLVFAWPKLKTFVLGRKELANTLEQWHTQQNQKPVLWIHVASLGEFEQIRPFIEALRTHSYAHFLWISFFSPSGYQVRHNYSLADQVTYLPYDTPSEVHNFLAKVRPKWGLLVKSEWWPELLRQAAEKHIPIFSVGTRCHHLPWIGASIVRQSLQSIQHFFAQDAKTIALLNTWGFANCTLVGDTRYDNVWTMANKTTSIALLEGFSLAKEPVVVWGSIWKDDWRRARQAISALGAHWRHILVPHEISKAFLNRITADLKGQLVRYSDITADKVAKNRILLVDCVGLLGRLYAYGTMAYVGGGFHGALHNVLEPAAHECPIVFGYRFDGDKFPEAVGLKAVGGARSVRNASDLTKALQNWHNKTECKQAGKAALGYVKKNKGATKTLATELLPLLKD